MGVTEEGDRDSGQMYQYALIHRGPSFSGTRWRSRRLTKA